MRRSAASWAGYRPGINRLKKNEGNVLFSIRKWALRLSVIEHGNAFKGFVGAERERIQSKVALTVLHRGEFGMDVVDSLAEFGHGRSHCGGRWRLRLENLNLADRQMPLTVLSRAGQ